MALSAEQRQEVIGIAKEAAEAAYGKNKAESESVLAQIKEAFQKVHSTSEATVQ